MGWIFLAAKENLPRVLMTRDERTIHSMATRLGSSNGPGPMVMIE